MKHLFLILIFFVSSKATCSEEVQIADFREANAWQDAHSVLASSQYYLIELVPFGQPWVPYIKEDKLKCWKKKYTFKIIYLSDGVAGYEGHIDNVLRREYAAQFNKMLTRKLIKNKLESECKI